MCRSHVEDAGGVLHVRHLDEANKGVSMKQLSAACLLAALASGCSSAWQYTDIPLSQCVAEAKLALRDSDFTQNLHITSDGDSSAVFGEHGDYKASILCQQGKRTVKVAGWDLTMTSFYKESIVRRF